MRIILITFIVVFTCFFSCKSKEIQHSTILPKNINQEVLHDLASVFTVSEKQHLTNKIITYEARTTNEIAILTVDSISPYQNPLEYATDVAIFWGIGKKKPNNGLLLLFSMSDRQMAIATGNVTEKILADEICQEFINTILIPKFKTDDYFEGVNICLDTIMNTWKSP
ncbi:MAG: TPM domain-containing protein [Flavobacteriaceae bacterium]|nr:TPM domain-containing protein [Flavobacteriaceae bacterium]